MRLDEGKELSDVHGCYQVTGVEDRALNLEVPAGFILSVMVVNHTLDFGGLDDWIESSYLICDLDYLSRYRFPGSLCCWGKKIGVEALKEVTKTFSTDKVLVLGTTACEKSHTVLVDLRRSVSRPHSYTCVSNLRE